MRYLLFTFLLFSGLHMSAMSMPVATSDYAMSPQIKRQSAGSLALLRHEYHYALSDGMHEKVIRPELISKPLRSMDTAALTALLEKGNTYIKIVQCDDGEFTLELIPRQRGGGMVGAGGGAIAGEVIGKAVPLILGYAILYGTKGIIRVTAGKEASDAFDQHIVQVSIPRLHEVTETIAHVAGAAGGVAGGIFIPG